MADVFFTKKKRNLNPKNISGLQAWYDASDITTITKDGSNLVSQWNDKSGNGRNATATTTARPTYTANYQNGKSALVFDGVANNLSIPNISSILGINKTIFICAKQITVKSGGAGIFFESTFRPLIYLSNGSIQVNYANATGMSTGGGQYTTAISISAGNNFNAVWQNNSSSYLSRLNKTTRETNVGTFLASSDTGTEKIGSYGGANFGNIAVYELLIYNQILTLPQIQTIESYLSNKWGF